MKGVKSSSNGSRDKFCEDNVPREYHEKISKIDMSKQDLKTHTFFGNEHFITQKVQAIHSASA
jgi:hypothetical protein